ncbi:hypothetical protein [Streptomyces monomycini]|nr:hypothetical protein [Streptomyces monomycini]
MAAADPHDDIPATTTVLVVGRVLFISCGGRTRIPYLCPAALR